MSESTPPAFMRESMWRLLDTRERNVITALLSEQASAAARLSSVYAEVEKHRKLSRNFGNQAKALMAKLAELKTQEADAEQLDELIDDLGATVEFAESRSMANVLEDGEGVLEYTVPPGTMQPKMNVDAYSGAIEPLD